MRKTRNKMTAGMALAVAALMAAGCSTTRALPGLVPKARVIHRAKGELLCEKAFHTHSLGWNGER